MTDKYTRALANEMDDMEWLRRAQQAAHINASKSVGGDVAQTLWVSLAVALDTIRANKIRQDQALEHLRQMGIEVDQ